MSTVAIVSDTHGYLHPRIVAIIRECDYAMHAGDVCGAHVLAAMQPKTGTVIAVAGNNDPRFMPELTLPAVGELHLPDGLIRIEHGHLHGMAHPNHASLRTHHAHARVVVYGHTHRLTQDRSALPWILNPGAAGQMRTHGGASCLVLTTHREREWTVQAYRFPPA